MSHEEEDDIIILSVTLPADCATPLDNLVSGAAFGSTREDVVCHLLCSRLGVNPNLPSRGESASGVAEEPTE